MADPVAVREQNNPAIELSADEKRLYSQIFKEADKEGLGVVTGDIALSFFPQRTKLPVDVLGEIWQIADVEDKGFLTPNGFYIVLRLIGYAQAGKAISAEAALKPGPLPRFDGVNGTASATQPLAAPLQPQGSGSGAGAPIRVPPLSPEKAHQYASLFDESGAQGGLLPGATAKQIFDRAQLPNDILVRIWNLADTEMRGMLSCTEFIIAMHLLASFRSGAMRALPQSLPAGLYEAAARRGTPARPNSASRGAPGSPTSQGISRSSTGGPGRATSPLASQSYIAPQIPAQAISQAVQPAADGWLITAAEKAKYDNQFAKLDVTSKGFVSGDEAVGFFSKSGLSENDLAQIWDLSDIKSEGKLNRDEFAVAMYLIVQNVQSRVPIPQTLPGNLVPPSMRSTGPGVQKSTAPDFHQPEPLGAPKNAQSAAEDLFGLDALAGPAQAAAAPAPAPAQTVQSTGGSSSYATPSSPRAQGSPAPSSRLASSTTLFKPFQPSSSFGQGIVSPQSTGVSSGSQSKQPSKANDDLLGDNDEASRNIGSDSVEYGNLSNQMNTLSRQSSDMKAKRAATEENISQASSQKYDLQNRLAQLRQTYEQEARDVRALEERLTNVRNENTKLQQDIALVQHSQENLTEQHQQIARQLAADQEENTKLKEQISAVNTEVTGLKPQIDKVRSDARQQRGLVAINKKQLATVEAERDRLRLDLESSAKEHEQALQELADIQSKANEAEREREAIAKQAVETRQAHEAALTREPEPPIEPISKQPSNPEGHTTDIVSPVPSTNSMNPFFKRSVSGLSADKSAPTPPPAASAALPNHSAFDEFFAPSLSAGAASTPPPPVSFGQHGAEPSSAQVSHDPDGLAAKFEEPAEEAEQSRSPPFPPQSRQISSNTLNLRSDAATALAFASGAENDSSSQYSAPSMQQAASMEPRQLSEIDSSAAQNHESTTIPSAPVESKELPGAFPAETPVQTPVDNAFSQPAPSSFPKPNADPFFNKSSTPVSARDDFDSAFADFSDGVPKSKPDGEAPTEASQDRSTAEFPPIQHFENDSSDSDSDNGFDDNFTPPASNNAVAPPPAATREADDPPPANAQASPPSYVTTLAAGGTAGEPSEASNEHFPAEYRGLLPAREDPTSLPHQAVSAARAEDQTLPTQPTTAGDFGVFDDDFKDLSEAQVADEENADDMGASIASRRDTLDEFNPTFDTPVSSVKFLPTAPQQPAAANGGGEFANFYASASSTSGAAHSTTASGNNAGAFSSSDWDEMFADLGDSSKKAQVVESSGKPSLGRGVSTGMDGDDPILKNLTGMGFSREESLRALEKYDYNINKAADYLTSKS